MERGSALKGVSGRETLMVVKGWVILGNRKISLYIE